ncbi:Beta-lactamase-related domain containing protein [Aphelenchoides bicaudatus]|nr:Beta-lactamase-related domain containing protein [Aphelenchoides bicaudatus]
MDQNSTLTVFLLPQLMLMADKDVPSEMFIRQAVIIVLIPLFAFLLVAEMFRRSVSRKVSVEQKPNTNEFIHVNGRCDKEYEQVRQAFYANLEQDWEKGGASLSVYHKGRLVVDLWGGYADKESNRLWQKDTLNISFSSTKAVSALCIGMLVDRGHLSYDDLVIKYWPEFGKYGKDKITIQWVLSHMAGLAYLDMPIQFEDAKSNPDEIARLLEEQRPNWTPGEFVGYHALTYGWLLDQIVRRTDPEHRSLGEFYRQEIASTIEGLDYHIGLPKSEAYRFIIGDTLKTSCPTVCWPRVERSPSWLRFVFQMTLNDPEIQSLEQGAVLGIGTARSLANIFQKAIMERKFFKKDSTLRQFLTPFINKPDIVTGAVVSRGNGLMFSPFQLGQHQFRMIGHAGVGGQNIKFDPENELVFCYLSNGLKCGFGDSARTFVNLRNAIYSSVIEQTN